MGNTAVTRFGYGVKITDGPARSMDEYDDLEFFLINNYPLLDDGWAGNFWGDETEQWVFVKSTLVTEYDYKVIIIDPEKFLIPDEGLAELNRFISETPLAAGKPHWAVLSSLG
jgi:hypothetical protein